MEIIFLLLVNLCLILKVKFNSNIRNKYTNIDIIDARILREIIRIITLTSILKYLECCVIIIIIFVLSLFSF